MTGDTPAYAVMRVFVGLPRKNLGAPVRSKGEAIPNRKNRTLYGNAIRRSLRQKVRSDILGKEVTCSLRCVIILEYNNEEKNREESAHFTITQPILNLISENQ